MWTILGLGSFVHFWLLPLRLLEERCQWLVALVSVPPVLLIQHTCSPRLLMLRCRAGCPDRGLINLPSGHSGSCCCCPVSKICLTPVP
jgi:hypothetical protein